MQREIQIKATFVLDLEKAQLPPSWPSDVREIKVQEGNFQHDLDVTELSPEVYEHLKQIAKREIQPSVPIGLDITALPVGAVLRRIS